MTNLDLVFCVHSVMPGRVSYPIQADPRGKPPGSSLPVLSVHYFTNSWPMLFLNQWKGKNGHVQIFTKACARCGVEFGVSRGKGGGNCLKIVCHIEMHSW